MKEDRVIDSIKCFLKVNKYIIGEYFFVYVWLNFVNNIKDCMFGWVLFMEIVLRFIE